MPRTIRLAGLATLTLAAAAVLAACSGSGAGATATTAASAPAASAADSTGTTGGATARISANTATTDEIVAALTAAGVPNPERWAREIQEYRPYDASDTALTRLQQNLAKYNPDAATLAGILSVLQP